MTAIDAAPEPMIRSRVAVPIRDGIRTEYVTFYLNADKAEHLAILFPGWEEQDAPLVRVHSECLTGDVFGSRRCDCGPQLNEAIDRFAREGGILLYLRQEGRGIGLYNKLDAYILQSDKGVDTFTANHQLGFPADGRSFAAAAEMLRALGVAKIRLLTNNPEKARQLTQAGIRIAGLEFTGVHLTAENRDYLSAKQAHGHNLAIRRDSDKQTADERK